MSTNEKSIIDVEPPILGDDWPNVVGGGGGNNGFSGGLSPDWDV